MKGNTDSQGQGNLGNLCILSKNVLLGNLLEDFLFEEFRDLQIRKLSSPSLPHDMLHVGTLLLYDCHEQSDRDLIEVFENELKNVIRLHKIALFNIPENSQVEIHALNLGICGFFYETDAVTTLAKGIKAILNDEVWVSRKGLFRYISSNKQRALLNSAIAREKLPELTLREQEILHVLAKGETNASIADQLCLSEHTVRTHIYNIFRKIGVSNRNQAILWYLDNHTSH